MTTASKVYLHHLETVESFAFASEDENGHCKHKRLQSLSLSHTHTTVLLVTPWSWNTLAFGCIYMWPGSRVLLPGRSDGLVGSGRVAWPSWRSDISGTRPCEGQAEEVLQRLSHLPRTDVVNRMSWSLERKRKRGRDTELVETIGRNWLLQVENQKKKPATNSSSNCSWAVKPLGIRRLQSACEENLLSSQM